MTSHPSCPADGSRPRRSSARSCRSGPRCGAKATTPWRPPWWCAITARRIRSWPTVRRDASGTPSPCRSRTWSVRRHRGSNRSCCRCRRAERPTCSTASSVPDSVGLWTFRVDGWGDPIATWRKHVTAKLDAGQSESRAVQRPARSVPGCWSAPRPACPASCAIRSIDAAARLRAARRPVHPRRRRAVRRGDRRCSSSIRCANWSRAASNTASGWTVRWPGSARGTRCFRGPPAAGTPRATPCTAPSPPPPRRCPRIAKMGFDVVYLPPIHPIGKVHRKGRNNTRDRRAQRRRLTMGDRQRRGRPRRRAPEAGHHRGLRRLRRRRRAIRAWRWRWIWRCSARPTIRGRKDHPEWFTVLPDGTIAYAENPPKKYQDIYPINFDNDPPGIYEEVLRVVRYWIAHGVKIFRVDNPHTKPPNFWAWLIGEVKNDRPRRAVPGRGVHPARPPVRAGQARLHAVLHVLHLAHREVGADRVRRADRRARRLRPAEPVRQYARHPAREPAARRSRHVRDPRRAGVHDELRRGACTPGSSCSSTDRFARAARSTWTPRSTSCGPATSTPHWPTANRWSRS